MPTPSFTGPSNNQPPLHRFDGTCTCTCHDVTDILSRKVFRLVFDNLRACVTDHAAAG